MSRRGFARFLLIRNAAKNGQCCAVVTNSNGNRGRMCKLPAVTKKNQDGQQFCRRHENDG
jgi:hypothetical protein